jgi:hypothetical protein
MFGGTQFVDTNFCGFQDFAPHSGFDCDAITTSQVLFRDSRAASEELRTVDDVDEPDSGSASTLIVVFYHSDSASVDPRNRASQMLFQLDLIAIEPLLRPNHTVRKPGKT